MQSVFRKRCDDLVNEYVKASLKREYSAREICLILEEKMRKDRRLFRKRIAALERDKRVSDRSIEDLAWEVEQLNFRLKSMGVCLEHQVKSRIEAIEARLGGEEQSAERVPYEEAVAALRQRPIDEVEWTRI